MQERWKLAIMSGVFLAVYWLPIENLRVQRAVIEGFELLKWYAREHVVLCLVPAFFIAGAVAEFVNQGTVLRYLGSSARRSVAYGVASVSGAILAVCSCTVLPLFASIYKRGAGLGPAIAFLYSGPAINVLAIILTARILGLQLGVARAVGSIAFAAVIGLTMAWLFRKEDRERLANGVDPFAAQRAEQHSHRAWRDTLFLAVMVGILVFANWGSPNREVGFFALVWRIHWPLTAALSALLGIMIVRWYTRNERSTWVQATWGFAKQILPLLFAGVLVAGWLMGRPGHDSGLIPAAWISRAVGGNSLSANLFAAIAGAFMYFATLTEVPILQALIGAGMGRGPALTLLLAGPALSLPNMLVINSYIGPKKTIVYVSLVIVMSTISGLLFGALVGSS